MKSNEFIILRLPSNSENIIFIYQIFSITQYVFYDDRFPTKQLKEEHPNKFNKEYYDLFREKCLEVNNREIEFTVNEFIFLSKLIDFVSKCFIGEPNTKLAEVINDDFKDENEFDYNKSREMYLHTATKFFEGFRRNCKNEILLKKISDELNWKIDI
jgi:hypothetical protein